MWIMTFWVVTFLVVGGRDFSVMTSMQTNKQECQKFAAADVDNAMRLQFGDGSHPDNEIFVTCMVRRTWQVPT